MRLATILPVNLVLDRGRANHEGFDGRFDARDGVINPDRKTAKLACRDGVNLAFDLNRQAALQYNETFIALMVRVQTIVLPRFVAVVVPDLQFLRGEAYLVRRLATGEERRMSWAVCGGEKLTR